jgi:hypothetical protein
MHCSNDQFFEALRSLIDCWCGCRNLKALRHILGPYLAFNGMTDGWGELYKALRNLRADCWDTLPLEERETLKGLIATADNVLNRR